VLVHGTGGFSTRWKPILPALEKYFTVYAVDRRGRGESGDGSNYAIEREFDDVAAVVDPIGNGVDRLRAQLDSGDRRGVLTTFFHEVVRMPAHEFELFQLSPAFPARIAAAHTLPRKLRVHEAYQFKPERFKTLNVPTLLLLGGHSPSFSKAAIEAVNGALPNSRIVVLPGQQHIAMDTAPDLFVREVLAFLAKPA
jgi:pimeloyl-ACP methyl ester carboxylesterase